jgi:hypothetical protein
MRKKRNIFPLLILYSAVVLFVLVSASHSSQTLAQLSTANTESKQTGTNIDLAINPPSPILKTKVNNMTLSFLAKSKDLEGSSVSPGKIDHLDYKVSITKDAAPVWSKQFHDHDGNLILQIKPSPSGSNLVTGGTEDPGRLMTGPYVVEGPILIEAGKYSISAQIVGIEFNPLPSPLSDNFILQVLG